MKTCPKCNKEVVEGWKLCPYCGESLQQNECPACHKQVQPDWNRCPFCGELLKNQAPQTPLVSNSTDDLFDYSEIEAGLDSQLAHNAEYEKNLVKARAYAVRGKYAEATEIYEKMLEDDPTDMHGYMGLIRVATKSYTEFEGEEIENAVRVAKQICGGEEIGEYDPDYAAYVVRREKYFADKAEAERKAEEARRAEAERKAREEAERKAREEAERKAREEAERKAKEEAERKAREETERKARKEATKPQKNGNTIKFGLWPQSAKANNVTVGDSADEDGYYTGSDGALYAKVERVTEFYNFTLYYKVEPIEWRILSESNGKAVILSEKILAGMAYGESNYQNSHVRRWLNDEFYNKAFPGGAKNYIETTTVDNSAKSTGYSSNPDDYNNTNDKVFLLSYEEALNKYGLTDSSRQKKPTEYAEATGARGYSGNGNVQWWLRSPYYHYYGVYGVKDDGTVRYCNNSCGVVPALLIRL